MRVVAIITERAEGPGARLKRVVEIAAGNCGQLVQIPLHNDFFGSRGGKNGGWHDKLAADAAEGTGFGGLVEVIGGTGGKGTGGIIVAAPGRAPGADARYDY